jgi:hypothetical protein
MVRGGSDPASRADSSPRHPAGPSLKERKAEQARLPCSTLKGPHHDHACCPHTPATQNTLTPRGAQPQPAPWSARRYDRASNDVNNSERAELDTARVNKVYHKTAMARLVERDLHARAEHVRLAPVGPARRAHPGGTGTVKYRESRRCGNEFSQAKADFSRLRRTEAIAQPRAC